MTTFPRAKAYLQVGCPFSMRLRIFLAEAGLDDEVEIIAVERGSDVHHELFAVLRQAGATPSFPVVERTCDEFEVDSQAIIDRMAREHDIDAASLPMLRFYNDGMLPRFGKMFMELKRLKGADWNGNL